MVSNKRELTYDQLVSLLQTSSALQTKREFTRADLLAAANELGIEAELVSELADRQLARRQNVPAVAAPDGTRIELDVTPDELHLRAPPVRFGARHLVALGFLSFWFGTIAVIDRGGPSRANALFTVPFLFAGVVMALRTVLPLVQTTRLTLRRGGGSLEMRPFGARRALAARDLNVQVRGFANGDNGTPASVLVLEDGTRTYRVLGGFSPREHRWIESEIRGWLAGGLHD